MADPKSDKGGKSAGADKGAKSAKTDKAAKSAKPEAGADAPTSHRTRQLTPSASLSASAMTSALRCSESRLASGADSCVNTNVLSSIARTVAPANITSVVRLR